MHALGRLGKAGKAAISPQSGKTIHPAGQNLMHIGLVADVKNDAIFFRVKSIVYGNGQLHHAEIGGEMAARLRDVLQQKVADLGRKPIELRKIHLAQILRRMDGFQQFQT